MLTIWLNNVNMEITHLPPNPAEQDPAVRLIAFKDAESGQQFMIPLNQAATDVLRNALGEGVQIAASLDGLPPAPGGQG